MIIRFLIFRGWFRGFTDVLGNLLSEVLEIFRKSENLSWGSVVRSPIVSVPASAAYRGQALISGLANP